MVSVRVGETAVVEPSQVGRLRGDCAAGQEGLVGDLVDLIAGIDERRDRFAATGDVLSC